MKIKIFIFFILILLSSCGQKSSHKDPPKAVKGVIDLSNWDFEKDGPVYLKGEWGFYWNQFLKRSEDLQKTSFFLNPNTSWTSLKGDTKRTGYASYTLKIKGLKGKKIAFKSDYVRSAFEMWKVSKNKSSLIQKAGIIAKTAPLEVPEFKSFVTDSLIGEKDFFLVLNVSNFHYRSGAIGNFKMGNHSDLTREFEIERYVVFFLIGILFIFGSYHLGLYFNRKEDKASLYFSIFCFNLFLRQVKIGNIHSWLLNDPNWLLFDIFVRIDYLSLIFGPFFYAAFLNHLFDQRLKVFQKASLINSLILSTLVIFLPTRIFSYKMILLIPQLAILVWMAFGVYFLTLLIFKRVPFSKIVLLGALFLVFGVIFDILISLNPNFFNFPILPLTLVLYIFIQCYVLSKKFSQAYKKSELLSLELEETNSRLEEHIQRATEELRFSLSEIQGMLSNINKAIFYVDQSGKIYAPVSKYSKQIFGKDIVGGNGLNLLFFNLKNEEKKYFIKHWKTLFHCNESEFLFNAMELLPRKVVHPDKRKKRGRALSIQYTPLCNKEGTVKKVMFIVDDVTEIEEKYKKNRERSDDYDVLIEVISFEDKEGLSKGLSQLIRKSIFDLEIMISPSAEELTVEEIDVILFNLLHEFNSTQCNHLEKLEGSMSKMTRDLKNVQKFEKNKLLAWTVETLSNSFLILTKYAEALNTLHKNKIGPGISYSLPEGFEKSIEEKRQDLDRIMVNLLEYVFLVRKVEDLDQEKMSNAPKKAQLYGEFDTTISLLLNRSRLIAFLLKVSGNHEASDAYMELSELLRQMPSKDRLTEAALMNYLIAPYRMAYLKIRSLQEKNLIP